MGEGIILPTTKCEDMGADAEYHLEDFSQLQISTIHNQQFREAPKNVNGKWPEGGIFSGHGRPRLWKGGQKLPYH